MSPGRGLLALALAAAVACGGDGGGARPEPITPSELEAIQREAAMQFLQSAVAAEMRVYVERGRFTEDPAELDAPSVVFVPGEGPGADPGQVSVETCEGATVVVLANTAQSGDVLAVKARGLLPASEGEAVFSHYAGAVPPCDATDGPDAWPGGYFVSRQGLQREG